MSPFIFYHLKLVCDLDLLIEHALVGHELNIVHATCQMTDIDRAIIRLNLLNDLTNVICKCDSTNSKV